MAIERIDYLPNIPEELRIAAKSGRHIPNYWEPETALAVFDLIDELRDAILAVYETKIQDLLREHSQVRDDDPEDRSDAF